MASGTDGLEALIREGGVQEVLNLHNELQRLLTIAKDRLRGLRAISEFSVALVDANTYTDTDVSYNSATRYVDAEFSVGPRKARFAIEIEHENVEGDLRTNIRSRPPLIRVENNRPRPPKDSAIENFLGKAGWQHAMAASCSNMSDEDIAGMNEMQMRRWVFADIVQIMVQHIIESKGEEDLSGVGLGIDEEDMYTWLKLK